MSAGNIVQNIMVCRKPTFFSGTTEIFPAMSKFFLSKKKTLYLKYKNFSKSSKMTSKMKYCPIKKRAEKVDLGELSGMSDLCISNPNNIEISSSRVSAKPKQSNYLQKFEQSFQQISSQISQFKLIESHKCKIYDILKDLTNEFGQLILSATDNKLDVKCAQILKAEIDTLNSFLTEKISDFNTTYKRLKTLKENKNYVEPVEKAIGLKWNTKQNPKIGLPDHTISQTTFQYISIIKRLECLFAQPKFKKEYFDFNQNSDHVCKDGIYEYFCCSEIGKNYRDKTAIKIRLATDDCELCDPLKTKNVIHKLNCVYFTVDNMPAKYTSKLDNLYPVSLCETSNIKADRNTFDEVGEVIRNEIKQLQSVGINVDGQILKGSLVRVISDNLGINGVFGFTESFNSYFCRSCEISKSESETLTKERSDIMRTKDSYENCLKIASGFIDRGKQINLKETKGIKRPCVFNDLEEFHILDNICFDVMHDVNEGIIPFFLSKFFEYCDAQKIVKKTEIQRIVRDFIYGILNKQKKPSFIMFDKPTLGQNATQSYLLMIHLPFIFAKYKDELRDIWISAESLLKMMQIIYSTKITDEDINNLTSYTEIHFVSLQRIFNAKLLPKHHLVLHYPNAIRKIGPLIHYWMMRFESKHAFFTNAAKNTNNFQNIAKTLAYKHEEAQAYKPFATDVIDFSKKSSKFKNDRFYKEYSGQITTLFDEINIDDLEVRSFARLNSFEYREGLMIISDNIVLEIVKLLSFQNQIFFICAPYKIIKFDAFYNSIEIEKCSYNTNGFSLHQLDSLKNPKSYERKSVQHKMYLICDTLEFKHLI